MSKEGVSFKNKDRFIQLGIAISTLRKLRGMSQDQLAEKATSNFCCYFEGAICHSSHRSPAMRTESVRFILSIPMGVQQSKSQVYGV